MSRKCLMTIFDRVVQTRKVTNEHGRKRSDVCTRAEISFIQRLQ